MPRFDDVGPRFHELLRPHVARMSAEGITANGVTVGAAAVCVAMGAALAAWPGAWWLLILVPDVLIARMVLKAISGTLASEHGQASRLAVILNEAGDVASDAVLYLPLGVAIGSPAWTAAVVVAGIVGELVGVMGEHLGGGRRHDGPLGIFYRALLFGALALLVGLGVPTGWWFDVVLAAALVAALLTIVNRTRRILASDV